MVFHPQGEWFVNPAFLVWYLFDVCCWERLGMAWDGDVFAATRVNSIFTVTTMVNWCERGIPPSGR